MWDNFIGQQIRRCNRNLLVVNLLLLSMIIAYVAINSRYLANFVLGATDISNTELASLHDPYERPRFFVRVHGEKSFDTGVQSIEQTTDKYSNKVESTTVKAEYHILMAGNRLLVVKADLSASGETFTGALEAIPASVYQEVIRPVVREKPDLQGAFLPAMLNANDYREEGWWSAAIIIPLLTLIGWNLWKWQRRFSDYNSHPIYWRMTSFGSVDEVVQHIEAAMRVNQLERIGRARIYGPWLFKKSFFGLICFHLPDVVWVYEKVTQRYTNHIPTGKSFSVLLIDRHGYTSEFQMSKKKAETLVRRIAGECPWIVSGYSDERENLWISQRAAFVAMVDERKMGTASTARAAS